MKKKLLSLAAVAAMSIGSVTHAATDFSNPVSPAWRPGSAVEAVNTLTTRQSWVGFDATTPDPVYVPTATYPDPANGANSFNPNGSATAYDGDAPADGAFLIGSPGDIYSMSETNFINPVFTVPGYGVAGSQLNVQIEIQWFGQQIDTDALLVNGVAASTLSNYSVTEVYNSGPSDFGGFGTVYTVDDVWNFSLADTDSLQLNFGWGVSSSALQTASIDTQSTVPEPASVALLALGGPLLLRRRNRASYF